MCKLEKLRTDEIMELENRQPLRAKSKHLSGQRQEPTTIKKPIQLNRASAFFYQSISLNPEFC